MSDIQSMRNLIWTEKFRPRTIEETILPQEIRETFTSFRDTQSIPNLLLSGPPGTGKTTIAKALLRELNYEFIFINGSDSSESGIDALRTRIRTFASSVSLEGKKKFILIDEADHLSPMVQPALREFMERFAENAGFILTCNYMNRIIEPLRSRMSIIEFTIHSDDKKPVIKQFHKRVCEILDQENVQYDPKVVLKFIIKHFPDFRRVLNELQKFSVSGEITEKVLRSVKEETVEELMQYLKSRDFSSMRKWVAENIDIGSAAIFRKLFESMNDYLKTSSIPNMVIILADYQYKSVHVPDEELNMVAALVEVMAEVEFKDS
jgi:DNA polymerase III delta prime subunit